MGFCRTVGPGSAAGSHRAAIRPTGAVLLPFAPWTSQCRADACFQHHLAMGLVSTSDLFSLPVVPMPLVSAAISLVVGGLAAWMFLYDKLQGRLMWLSFSLYGILRFGTQWFRPNYDLHNDSSVWNSGHTMSILMCFIGITLYVATARVTTARQLPHRFARRLEDRNRSRQEKARLRRIAERKRRG